MVFDPYHKWLGIAPSEQPANHYRLLSLQLFEDDAEIIAKASERQFALLKSFAGGEFRAHAVNVLREIAEARSCLLDPDRKSAYDAHLKQRSLATVHSAHSTPAHSHARASARSPVAAPVGEGTDDGDVAGWASRTPHVEFSPSISVSSRYRRPKKRWTAWRGFWLITSIVLGGLMGTSAGYFLLCVYDQKYDFLNLLHGSPQSDLPIPSSRQPLAKTRAPKIAVPPDRRMVPEVPLDVLFARNKELDRRREGSSTAPQQVTSEISVKSIIDVAGEVDLPPIAAKDRIHQIGRIALENPDEISLNLKEFVGQSEAVSKFAIHHADDSNVWTVHFFEEPFGDSVEIAQFLCDQEILSFQWTINVPTTAFDELRNCLLEIQASIEKKDVLLRKPLFVEPLTIDLAKPKQLVVCKCDSPPSRSEIRLDLFRFENFPPFNVQNGDFTNGRMADDGTWWYQNVTGVAGRCRILRRGNNIAFEIQHRYTLPSGGDFILTIHQVDRNKKNLENLLNEANAASDAIPRLQSYLSQLKSRLRSYVPLDLTGPGYSNPGARANTEVGRLRSEIDATEKKLIATESLAASREHLRRDLAAIEKIMDLGNQIHNISKIHFRFYTLVGDRDVDLVASKTMPLANGVE